MRPTSFLVKAVVAILAVFQYARAQSVVTEPNTGMSFYAMTTNETEGGFTWGYALPPGSMTTAATEYIGYVVGAINSPGPSWSGISHGGPMTNSLLLMFWPEGDEILTSFRWAAGYVAPDLYSGTAELTPIYSNVNATHYTLVYRCQGCFEWDQNGATGSQPSTQGYFLLGWCQAYSGLQTPSSEDTAILQEHDTDDLVNFQTPASAVQASYSQWATRTIAAQTSTAAPTTTTSISTTTSVSISGTPAPTTTYDYIVVGAGAGGIPMADKLSAAGHSVLLIERGPPSSYRWGGTVRPPWLDPTNATRFDVPGLDNEIWKNSSDIACPDNDVMTGCVLGGGTAINSGLWWHVPDIDWDYNFPTGWQATDVQTALGRVFSRIPGTYVPSMDGIIYLTPGYNLLGGALAKAGWENVTANSSPNSKNHTFSRPPWMYSYGERGGPLATYLVTANARSNFKMILDTDVKRLIRENGHVTGVETYAYAEGGYQGIFNVTATTGRVILSAGTFGSARVLFRSGIGPSDMLGIVQNSTDGPTMIDSKQWINLPVGYNLVDHCNTNTVISHPSIEFYDYYAAYNTPIPADASAYVNHRSGPLAQSAPNISPIFWDEIACSDGITRQLQWTARCEGSLGAPDNYSMTMSQYLGRGSTSRGRTTMDSAFNMHVTELPYLKTAGDLEAVTQGIINLQNALQGVANLTWLYPPPGQNASAFLTTVSNPNHCPFAETNSDQYPVTTSERTANHWLGTSKMGLDDGRSNSGTAVVDTNLKVYGTDNLFVVDASIFPGMMTTNPSAMIVTVAEHASDLILALSAPEVVAKYGQCGGQTYSGSSVCAAGTTCTYSNAYYWQCL